jgi:hypothetical protein
MTNLDKYMSTLGKAIKDYDDHPEWRGYEFTAHQFDKVIAEAAAVVARLEKAERSLREIGCCPECGDYPHHPGCSYLADHIPDTTKKVTECVWTWTVEKAGDDCWIASCNACYPAFSNNKGPLSNVYKFCPYCGRPIRESEENHD